MDNSHMITILISFVCLSLSTAMARTAGEMNAEALAQTENGDTKAQIQSSVIAVQKGDFAGAEMWLRRALQAGDEKAAWALLDIYTSSENPERRSRDEATRQIAELGAADFQRRLGERYLRGDGAEQNFQEAEKWLLLAAKQGNGMAASSLSLMYKQGFGVEKSDLEAYIWLRLSEEWEQDQNGTAGEANKGPDQEKAKSSERIGKKLSSSEKRRAESEIKKRMAEASRQSTPGD
jgi:hypothetical protein